MGRFASPPQPGDDRWTFRRDLQAPLWSRPLFSPAGASGAGAVAQLSRGVCLEAAFPDPRGRLDTAYDDLRRFLAAAGVAVAREGCR